MARTYRVHKCTSDRGRCRRLRARTSWGTPQECRLPSCLVEYRPPQRRQGCTMIAAKIEARAAISHGTNQDRLLRAEIVAGIGFRKLVVNIALDGHEVKNSGGELPDFPTLLLRHIARHGQSFEVNFGRHDG